MDAANNDCYAAGWGLQTARDMATRPLVAPIATKGVFPLMDLPPEIRIEIYKYLLVLPDGITVDHTEKQLLDGDPKSDTGRPSVAILQTCKCIDSEATPILYAQNKFTFRLILGTGPVANSFILNGLRWSTISCLSSISFLSNNAPLSDQQVGPIAGPYISSRPRPRFTCSGADIIARFTEYDLKYSPTGPNRYMVLSIYNWVSLQVMREELSEFQSELEAMMGPG